MAIASPVQIDTDPGKKLLMFSLWVAYWQVRRTYRLLAKPMEELVTVTTPGH